MEEYITAFLRGFVASIPSIIAVVSLLVNNSKADSRQLLDKKKMFELSLIESMYSEYSLISNQYIGVIAEIRFRLTEIVEETVFYGTESKKQLYQEELYSLCKRALFFATYKRKAFEKFQIDINPDEMSRDIVDVVAKIRSYSSVIAYISKLFVIANGEIQDKQLVHESVIEELEKRADAIFCKKFLPESEWYKQSRDFDVETTNLEKKFCQEIVKLSDKDKKTICSDVAIVVLAYTDSITKTDITSMESLEKQIVENINRLMTK